jgi:ribonucleotide monophosphatase NagD (HAD superfamily)
MITIPQGMSLKHFISREVGRACSYSRVASALYNQAANLHGKLTADQRPLLREQINTARALDKVWDGSRKYDLAYPLSVIPSRTVEMRRLIDSHDHFLVDIFGTCKDENGFWEEAAGALRTMVRSGKKVLIVSNTADYSLKQNQEQLQDIGVELPLSRLGLKGAPVLFYGNKVTAEYIEAAGGRPVGSLDHDFSAVVLSLLDTPLTGQDMAILRSKLLQRETPIILANSDMFLPRQAGLVENLALRLAKQLESKGMNQLIEVGKPDADIYEQAFRQLKARPGDKVLCIGDTLWTDIQGAKNFQEQHPELTINSLLVLSGTDRKVPHYKQMLMSYMDTINTYPTFLLPRLEIFNGN